MSHQSENQPLSRDQVVHELEFLLTVEHALIVEYLSVRCAMGYDLDPRDGGPATESGRAAAKASKDLADAQMLRVGQLVRALSGFAPTGGFGREIGRASCRERV